MAQLPASRRQQMRDGEPLLIEGHRQVIRVQPVGLAPVLPDPDLATACRVHQARLFPPLAQPIVDGPCLAARLDGHPRRGSLRAEQRQQLLHLAHGRSVNDLPVPRLAQADLIQAQIQSYTSHG